MLLPLLLLLGSGKSVFRRWWLLLHHHPSSSTTTTKSLVLHLLAPNCKVFLWLLLSLLFRPSPLALLLRLWLLR